MIEYKISPTEGRQHLKLVAEVVDARAEAVDEQQRGRIFGPCFVW